MSDATNLDVVTTPKEHWYRRDGARLFAVDVGRGEPVIFLHGGLADHRGSLRRVQFLAPTFRVMAPDVRGSGRSIHRGALSWEDLAADVIALMDHLDIERAVVGGVSAGSAVALKTALDHGDRVKGLIVMSPVYAGQDVGLTPAQRAAMERMDLFGRRAVVEGVGVLHELYAALPPETRALAREMVNGFDPASVAATTGFLASQAEPFASASELAAIAAPTLIIAGADEQHPAHLAALYAERIPEAIVLDPAAPDLEPCITAFCVGT